MQTLHKLLLFHVLTCLGQSAHGGEIINGKNVPKNAMQYMVSLQNNRGQHVCGGFLISKDFVLTAAHCDVGLARVVLGAHNLRKVDSLNIRDIEKKYKHPSYKFVGSGNDIMLLKLSHEVQLQNRVQTIQLPCSDMIIRENLRCRVTGWGSVTTGYGPAVNELKAVNVSVIGLKVCENEWSHLPAKVICAGGYRTRKGACQGDSGGPLVCNGRAVGIVSFNKNANCNYPDVPNVYTDISRFLPWIKSIVKGISC